MHKIKSIIYNSIFLIFLFTQIGLSQDEKKFITVTPGAQFEAGWLKEFFLGAHWRDVWTIPVEVEILDLEKFDGGLKAVKRGGGFQTKSLRLKGNDGKMWKFRSMDKDPSKTLPKILRNTIAADVLKDQISSAHPMAALVVAPILDSVGIIHNRSYLVYMPDDPKLGKFQEEFGGLLGMLEIHPDVDEDEGMQYRDSEKISSTFNLFRRLADKRSEKVHAREYLKARLVDIFLGDWDRHTDQWKWARYTVDGQQLWFPIPRDRDQAFAKFDGLLVSIAEYMVPQFVHFGEDYPQIEDLSWSGRFVDRRFLSEIDKPDWDSVAAFVKKRLTNELIELAVKELPKEMYEISKDELENKLKSRRDNLIEISYEYYELINDVIDIYCSDKNDFVEVNRISNSQTKVSVYKRNKKSGLRENDLFYSKIFDNELTNEIRIFLLDGDDKVIVEGIVEDSPVIRVIGGDGKDELEDKSEVKGFWLNITPFGNAENNTKFYDSGKKTKVNYGPGTTLNKEYVEVPEDDLNRYEPQQRDRSHDWFPKPILNLNADDGFIIGGGAMFTKFNFRKIPFDYFMSLTSEYATEAESGRLRFEGIFNSIINKASLKFNFTWTGLAFTQYYGYGNETPFDDDLESEDFYRLSQKFISINPNILFGLGGFNQAEIGFSYNYSNLSIGNNEILNGFSNGTFGLGKLQIIGLNSSYTHDSRDNPDHPLSGFYFNIYGSYFPELFDVPSNYAIAGFDARTYFTLQTFTRVALGLRAGGKRTWGDYPFFAAAFLGGPENIRGYSRERFSGDSAIFGQSELRIRIGEISFILPASFGLIAFTETGRVFVDGGTSTKWHPSYGGGFWLDYLERTVTLSVLSAMSDETSAIYFQLGMMF